MSPSPPRWVFLFFSCICEHETRDLGHPLGASGVRKRELLASCFGVHVFLFPLRSPFPCVYTVCLFGACRLLLRVGKILPLFEMSDPPPLAGNFPPRNFRNFPGNVLFCLTPSVLKLDYCCCCFTCFHQPRAYIRSSTAVSC